MLYSWDRVPESANRCILVEGSTDVHKLYSYGYPEAVAILGTGVTAEQQRLITERFDEVVLLMDNDPAGGIASLRNAEQLSYSVSRVLVAQYNEIMKKDPGEMSQTEVMQIMDDIEHWSSLYA